MIGCEKMRKRPKSVFGEYLVQEIKKAGISQEEFYTSVGITKPYFYDLLKASPPQPDLQKKMIAVLDKYTGEDTERSMTLLNLAAQGRGEIPADISDLLIANPKAWDTIRKNLTEMNTRPL